jgi:hypothetical protein
MCTLYDLNTFFNKGCRILHRELDNYIAYQASYCSHSITSLYHLLFIKITSLSFEKMEHLNQQKEDTEIQLYLM